MTLRLCSATRAVKLIAPLRTTPAHMMRFVEAQDAWLERQMRTRLPDAAPFSPGARIPYRGDLLQLVAVAGGRGVTREEGLLRVCGAEILFAGRVRRWLRGEAERLLAAETDALARRVGRTDIRVRLGDPRSRWGSCAADGRIAYSWRLIMAPDFVRQSVVAHEVAHLVEMNHGPGFWRLAAELLGTSHAPARAWLAANGPMLHAQGAEY